MNKPDSPYTIQEVDATRPEYAAAIHAFNALFPDDFVPLQPRHLGAGTYWWLVTVGPAIIAFAGMVPFEPFPRCGYLKRAAVLPAYRGKGLQGRLMAARLTRAAEATDWTHIVSECAVTNVASANNFIRAGFRLVEPERVWDKENLVWSRAVDRGAT
jgi:GNAT superfamily N-acetyltransferase